MDGATVAEPSPVPVASVVVVAHDSAPALERSMPALLAELRGDDELIVVDNCSSDGTVDAVRHLAPRATVLESERNVGYGAGCNAGAEVARGGLLIFLNPDAAVRPGFRDAIERPLRRSPEWGAWQGLVTSGDGAQLNSAGGVVHFTGIAWAGGAGRALRTSAGRAQLVGEAEASRGSGDGKGAWAEPSEVEPGVAAAGISAGEVAFASGACLAIPRQRWDEVGGFPADFFLYHEDVDLSLRMRLAGHSVGIEPAAIVDHDYEFDKGPMKWRNLERNRWATIVRTYPAALIAVLLPALVATELALLFIALTGGWLTQKLRAWADVLRSAPGLLRSRRIVQAGRQVSAAEFARALTGELDSPFLGSVGRSKAIGGLLRAYWLVARALLGPGGRR